MVTGSLFVLFFISTVDIVISSRLGILSRTLRRVY
jgi:hypothetical protein